MPAWLQIANGSILRFIIIFVILALLRILLLNISAMLVAIQRAGNRKLPLRAIAADTLSWLVPINRLHRSRPLYSFASFGFHLGLISSALFLSSHVEIIAAQFGLGWVTLAKPWLDMLTLLMIVCGFTLLAHRIYNHNTNQLSTFTDYALLALLLGIYTSGFLAGQPWNPLAYDALMLAHMFMGIALMVVAPFTKIAHCILYPILRLGSEIGWRFRAGDGDEVVSALYGPEGRSL